MTLPAITLPKVELPFDIPVLLHPAVDHFMIALPVVILVLELINLMMKKKALSGFSFFLIILTVILAAGAYLTGLVDGKEAFPALGEAAKSALAEHKLLGTYLLLASVALLFFKLLSMLAGGIMKALYLLVLIVFVAGIFKQGQEGGELVYKYGMNVEQVKVLDDELFDVKEELEEAKEEPTSGPQPMLLEEPPKEEKPSSTEPMKMAAKGPPQEKEEEVEEEAPAVVEEANEEEAKEEESNSETPTKQAVSKQKNTKQKKVQSKETGKPKLKLLLAKIDAKVKNPVKNLELKNLLKMDAMMEDQVSLDSYNIAFYKPKDIYLDQLNMVDNRLIYADKSLATYIQNDKMEIKARKLQEINTRKQQILMELEVLKNG